MDPDFARMIQSARQALAMSRLIDYDPDACKYVPSNVPDIEHHNPPRHQAFADAYNALASMPDDPIAFAVKLVEAYCDDEDAALFKMFWADRHR